jgi:2-oxoacid:acceptor oxidoreductase delta subunit (pyruvate/2-ketoisovalerate family)
MTTSNKTVDTGTLFIPRSYLSTESNKTGTWRFVRPRYDEKTAPCSAACPAGEDIGRIEMLTSQGLFKEAWETILLENPFPGLCGRVCFHPCESVCNRADFDQPIAIHMIERFLSDTASRYGLKPSVDRLMGNGRKVAIVGAGPAGLSAAYFLARLGYGCDIFEAASEPGGMFRWGLPAYRMAPSAVRNEILQIADLGVRIHCGKPITRDFPDQVKGSYDAVFLGCGHWKGSRLEIPGEESAGVEDGLTFLRRIARGEAQAVSGTVAVIGGGNTAMDVARSVARLGGKPLIIYRRRREDMPAFEDELTMAMEEGVKLLPLRAPVNIQAESGGLSLTLQHMRLKDVDKDGRGRVEPDGQMADVIRVSRVIKAVGQEPSESWLNPPARTEGAMVLDNSVLVSANRAVPVVYGGDLTTRVKSLAHAVASGKEAAMALDVLLTDGPDAVRPRLLDCMVGKGPSLSMEIYMKGARAQRNPHIVSYSEINTDYFHFAPRIAQPRLLIAERVRTFSEIDLKISANLAIREADRCFNCGLCNQCDNCRLFCPDLAVVREESYQGRRINYDYCKGCGICAQECPRNVVSLEEERGRGSVGVMSDE